MKFLNNLKIILITLTLCGCSVLPSLNSLNPWSSENSIESISVYIAPDPDLQHALNIDVVFIYSDTVHAMLAGFDAIQWFQQKSGVVAGYKTQLDILEWQMVSGYGDSAKSLPENHKDAIAVMAFAYFPDNPNAKAILTDLKTPWLVFESKQLKVQQEAPVSYNKTAPVPTSH